MPLKGQGLPRFGTHSGTTGGQGFIFKISINLTCGVFTRGRRIASLSDSLPQRKRRGCVAGVLIGPIAESALAHVVRVVMWKVEVELLHYKVRYRLLIWNSNTKSSRLSSNENNETCSASSSHVRPVVSQESCLKITSTCKISPPYSYLSPSRDQKAANFPYQYLVQAS